FSKGISYNLDGVALSGTQLGKAYTFCGLQKHRGVSYDKGRDNALIEALMQPQHLAIAPSEAEENELESSQFELETTAPGTPATANELDSSQSELVAGVPGTPATANELELQLSILPEPDETQWQKVRSHLAVEYSLPLELLEKLHSHSWLYADSEKAVFTARTLDGEASFAFVLDERGNFTTTHPLSSEAAFWVATTGEIERAVIACNPIEALSLLLIEQDNSTTAPATVYLGIERTSQLPIQFLQELDSVIIALAENSQLARNAISLLPNAELVNPQSSWNDIWIQLIEQEQQTPKQNNQQYKRHTQDLELD
ncbi:relaxase, partial [Microcoleus sp. AT13-A5]